MRNLIIISKCHKMIPINQLENWYHFHFKGVLAGSKVSQLMLKGKIHLRIISGEEYMMYIRLSCLDKGVLIGEILKAKNLEDCKDLS